VLRALRTFADPGLDTTMGASATRDRTSPFLSAPPWLWLILGLGACQLALGTLGFVLGVRGQDYPSPGIWERAAMLAFGLSSLWLVRGGIRDRRALWLAGVFMTVASAFAAPPAGALVASLIGPWTARPLHQLLQVEVFLPFCLWSFVRSFPRVLHLERGERLIRFAIVLYLLSAAFAVGLLADPLTGLANGSRGRGGAFAYWGVIALFSAAALLVSLLRSRSAPPTERRRVGRFLLGLALGLGPIVLEILAEALVPAFRRAMDDPAAMALGSMIVFPPLLFIPVLTAQAVVADRLLAVGPLLGRAARYLLARTTLTLLTVAPLAALGLYLYEHREERLAALLSGPQGLALISIGTLGVVLLASRDRLTRRLDHLFERSHADWPRLRLRAGQAIRKGSTTREAADTLLAELARELQVETASLLVAARDRKWFVPLAGHVRPLRSDSALITLCSAEPTPLYTDPLDPESVFALLPAGDQRWVTDNRTALLVPLVGAAGATAGLLALSAKRNKAPFTLEERWEISDLGQAVALALENKGLHDALRPGSEHPGDDALPATECLRCRLVHPSSQEECACGSPVVVAPLPRVLLGKLELQERLGQGGMGIVYRALDRVLERSVAVKTLPHVSHGATERLRQEARSMAAVSHPAVAVIHAVESWHGLPYLVVEHLAGGTLARRMRAPWPVEQTLRLGIELADALDAIHRRGLLHRDVKPSNIGFDGEGHPKLLDFGLARLIEPTPATALPPRGDEPWIPQTVDNSTRSWGPAGTPIYLSPEVLAGNAPGPQQDLWGLTLVLFELIAGVHPLRAEDLQRTLGNVRLARLDDLRKWAPACPEPVAAFFARALHRDPKQRPQNAAALQAELGALLALSGAPGAPGREPTSREEPG
jgi:hypothetical protein